MTGQDERGRLPMPVEPRPRRSRSSRARRGSSRRVVRRRRATLSIVASAVGGASAAAAIKSGAISPSAVLFVAACLAVLALFASWLDQGR